MQLRTIPHTVILALVARTHEHRASKVFMGGRDKPGHDDENVEKGA